MKNRLGVFYKSFYVPRSSGTTNSSNSNIEVRFGKKWHLQIVNLKKYIGIIVLRYCKESTSLLKVFLYSLLYRF